MALRVGLGWIWHIEETVPNIVWRWGGMVGVGVSLLITFAAFHVAAIRLATRTWSFRWTRAWMQTLLVAVGAAGAFVMVAHHLLWLPRETFFYYNDISDTTRNLSNARQMITALRIYADDHGGRCPDNLQQLVAEGIVDAAFLDVESRMILPGGMRMPWRVLGGIETEDSGSLPLVVSPVAQYGHFHMVACNDTGTSVVSQDKYEKLMARWREHLKEKGLEPSEIPYR
ncbi:MAG: hypothetical protein ACAI34_23120 [Verrucomicrobium sp.]|nr:hypothetical protein [Verrucomicrobium sp.]